VTGCRRLSGGGGNETARAATCKEQQTHAN
ncbi:hypothetical protein A2U01_0105236, partial [Trifolium medium]|nr:hypothetical protein [Trifolium medium]